MVDLPYSRGQRRGEDARIGQNDERARTARELTLRPAWRPTKIKTQAHRAENNQLVCVDPSNGGVTITLPRARNFEWVEVYVKHVGTSGTVTVVPTSGETIDAATTYAWNAPQAGYHFVGSPNYATWRVI